jgi:hypothetical protein
VRAWLASGEERETFAEREGVSSKQLGWWRWKLGEMGVGLSSDDVDPTPSFVELTLPTSSTIELVMPRGVVVRVPSDFDDDVLARMLSVLERGQRC